MQHHTSASGLYWSITGEVACDHHAPKEPRWTTERWQPLPVSCSHMNGYRYQCQHCAEDEAAIVHHDTTTH